ncbi:Uncharacterised protein [Bordetella pertussis]|nr:Uncharacterised protein [Bordetella pertussis]
MPSPMALEKASLAAKRVARKRTPRAGSRRRRAWNLASSFGPRIFCAKRSPWRASARSMRSMRNRSMPMPAMQPGDAGGVAPAAETELMWFGFLQWSARRGRDAIS